MLVSSRLQTRIHQSYAGYNQRRRALADGRLATQNAQTPIEIT
jgi:hypothetical protein